MRLPGFPPWKVVRMLSVALKHCAKRSLEIHNKKVFRYPPGGDHTCVEELAYWVWTGLASVRLCDVGVYATARTAYEVNRA